MRFFVSPGAVYLDKKIIEIKDKEELHHLKDVMRLKEGSSVAIFDGTGKEYSGVIKSVDKALAVIGIDSVLDVKKRDKQFNITLYQAIPKNTKIDFIIEKATELGVDRVVPMITERTEAFLKSYNTSKKAERWNKIAMVASKQCGRVTLPVISGITDFKDALKDSSNNADLIIFAALDKDSLALKTVLRNRMQKNISIFIGPEGDFSPDEVSIARKNRCNIVSLGELVLRAETAGIFVLSCLNYEYAS